MRLLLPMAYGYQITRYGAQLLTLNVEHQRKHMLVTSEPSVTCQTTNRYTDVVSGNKLFNQRGFT